MPFAQLGLSQPILRALAKEGYETPTPIQAQCIPHILQSKDVLGCAQTGTGKTAAFALPIIQRLMEMPIDKTRRGPSKARALILSPTRELALQIRDSFNAYGSESGLRSTVIFGGVSQFRQVQSLRDGVDIIIATPGRLIDLMDQKKAFLDEVRILVLDEADRMLDMGFIQPIRLIASKTPADRQTLLFSATMPPEIRKLADSLLKDPVSVAVSPVASAAPKIEQSLYHVGRAQKQALLTLLLGDRAMSRVVVFTKTKHGAEKVGRKLQYAGVRAETIHGNKAQNARKKALDLFRAGKARVLVATDVAARGLDVDGISHVINFDLPMEPEAYVHRIGRTGRAGATGIAISFCDNEEKGLLKQIERLTKTRVPTKALPTIDAAMLASVAASSDAVRAAEGDERESHARQFHQPRPERRGGFQSRDGRAGGSHQGGHGGQGRPRPEGGSHNDRSRGHGKPAAHAPAHTNVSHTVSHGNQSWDSEGWGGESRPAQGRGGERGHTGETRRSGHAPRSASHADGQSGGHSGGPRPQHGGPKKPGYSKSGAGPSLGGSSRPSGPHGSRGGSGPSRGAHGSGSRGSAGTRGGHGGASGGPRRSSQG